ncbi:unnamed protein product [Cylindrotheca closterium]|uniref:Reverse transcriptase Ty1/copia-type domain-containing protein n=1 Tax=Cylindrotheca closterium TaxID=2856 RepID=A0AAD2PW79_9STRA|nr:unnamed protein product [Cylindrotheca closterium]
MVQENIKGFTDKQVERANRARSVYHMAGAPGVQAFRIAVRSGLFKNCNVNEEDAIIAEKIHGRKDKAFIRMFKKIKARQDAEDLMDEDYKEHEWITANEDMDYKDEYKSELDNEETKQMLDELAAELVKLGKPDKEEVLFEFDDNMQEDVAVESEEEDGVARAGVRFADTDDNESDNKGIVRSYSDDGVKVGAKRVLCPRHNRSYFSQGVKMRPTERYRSVRICEGVNGGINGQDGVLFIQQSYLNKGLKIFKEQGKDAAMKELDQLIKHSCWTPISIEKLRPTERKKAVDAMMLLAKNNDGVTIKGRCVFKGNETRDWLSCEDTASPTALHEAIICTGVIDAHEGRNVMSMDIPDAFIQTLMPKQEEGEDQVIMKITGLLVDYMIDLDPTYRDFVVIKNGHRVIYVVILRAIYGMLQAPLLWYQNLRASLKEYGLVFNVYDLCIANMMVNKKQLTIRFHVDDVLASHMEQRVLKDFFTWINERYGGLKEVTCTWGQVHTYLGMTLDYSKKGKLKIRMDDYVQRMLDEFSVKFKEDDKQETPAGNNLLEVGKGKLLDKDQQTEFHRFVAKHLFLTKRRLDMHPTVAILASQVQNPNQSDWHKLVRLMRYMHSTKKWHLTLSADNLRVMKWYVDASFAVHPDFKSHTGGVMTMGGGAMQAMSKKQKLNSRSSTHAELIGVDDAITQVLWTRIFMEEQGYPIEKNILYQDNMSSILLEQNGRSSAGKRSRVLNIRYFFVTDQVEKGNLKIEHMPTDDMWGDYMTKPLQGEKFCKFWALIQGDQED